MKVYNYPMLPMPGSVLNQNITGPAMQLYEMFGFAIQISWTGVPNGTFKLQCSADHSSLGPPGSYTPTNWSDITDSPLVVTAAGNYTWNVYDSMFNWVRLVYTDASGGTSIAVLNDATFNGKGA